MERRRADGLVLAPLLIVAALVAHAAAYLAAMPDATTRTAELARTGHGYLTWAPELAGVCGLLLVVALALRVLAAARGARGAAVHPLVALVPAGGFLVQETVERLVGGGIPPGFLTERPILIGVVLQLALGLVALGACRLLVGTMDRLGRRLRRTAGPSRRVSLPIRRPLAHDLLRPRPLALNLAGRAPPGLSS